MGYEYNIVSFPGLGLGEMKLREVAFSLFGLDIAWYAIIITLGIALAYCYIYGFSRKKEQIRENDFIDYFLITVPTCVVGARLYYVLSRLDHYLSYENPIAKMINIRDGGLAIYGAVLTGMIVVFLISRYKKIHFLSAYDMICPALILAQGIGRFGNFVNGEAFGTETTNFLRMGLTKVYRNGTQRFIGYVHPTFLYEALWNFVGFAIMQFLYRKKRYTGQIFFFYIAWYGIGRFFIEQLRTDSLWLIEGKIRISALVGIICFIIGVGCSIYYEVKRRKEQHGNQH